MLWNIEWELSSRTSAWAPPCLIKALHNEFLGAIVAFIQLSTHKNATGFFGDERLIYTTLATLRRSGTSPDCILGKAEDIVHKCVRSNECPCPDNSPPVCKIIFVNVGILHKSGLNQQFKVFNVQNRKP